MCRIFLALWMVVLFPWPAIAQEYLPRSFSGQYLEPQSGILHGAGQDPDAFANYWDVMDDDEKPVVFMHYEGLNNIAPFWATSLKERLLAYKDQMVIIQLGLELVGITGAIAAGEHDEDIDTWLDGVEELGIPVYARLGYEFNGLAWNGYQPNSYKAAFVYLTEKIRERDFEIATVWNYVPDPTQPSNFMAYYPGNEYVDWWSINFFDPSQIDNRLTEAFLDSAAVYNYPVLIGESTPKDVGVLDGQADWDAWFDPFFARIAQEPGIKMTGYINWNWAEFPQWSTWGDARLERNTVVRQLFNDEMNAPIYTHARSERAYRELLGATETMPPAPVPAFRVESPVLPLHLSWDHVEDASGISRYLVYNRDELVDYTKKNFLLFDRVAPGDTLLLSVSALDRAGNEGGASPQIEVIVEAPEGDGNLISNGNFDLGLAGWSLTEFVANVSGIFDIDTTGVLEGDNSARVTILQNSGTNWHLQLEQPLRVQQNHAYAISYQVRASAPTTMEMWLQQSDPPFAGYAQRNIQLTTEPVTYQDTALAPVDDFVFMRFMLGTSGLNEIWIDAVSVVDLGLATPTSTDILENTQPAFELFTPYPNPSQSDVTISYRVDTSGPVHLDAYDVLGRRVASLVDATHSSGVYTTTWSPNDLPSGTYFIRLQVRDQSIARPITRID